jgi:hypothetical protein
MTMAIHGKTGIRAWALWAALLTVSANAQELRTRFHEYTEKFKKPANPVRIETATYLGGSGTEWLAGAAYLPDGTLAVAGTALGPEFTLGANKVAVLGGDGAAPAAPQATQDAKGNAVLPDWTHPSATAFVAWLAPDLKTVTRVVRWPWLAGGACGIEADATGLYVAGRAGANLAALAGVQDVTPSDAPASDSGAYVAKLSLAGDRLLWVRRFRDVGEGVRLRLVGGRVLVEGRWVYAFTPDGAVAHVARAEFHGSEDRRCRAVNPVDFSYAAGWDRNTHTGREPWRQPCLRLLPPPGASGEARNFYNWPPKDVSSAAKHLESDSSIRRLHYDDQGTLYAVGWSDGGNTVLERDITDVDKPQPYKGLGFSLWGAQVGSFCHVLKIEPVAPKLLNKTIYVGYLSGKQRPSSSNVTNLRPATDGSMLLTGHTGYGHIQTGDALSASPPSPGSYVTVLTSDWTSLRFSSVMLAAGQVRLHGDKDVWGMVAATSGGRHKAVWVSGAVEKERDQKAPIAGAAAQDAFGGGLTDGYLLVLDLGAVVK